MGSNWVPMGSRLGPMGSDWVPMGSDWVPLGPMGSDWVISHTEHCGKITVSSFSSVSLGTPVMYRFLQLSVGRRNSIISNIQTNYLKVNNLLKLESTTGKGSEQK